MNQVDLLRQAEEGDAKAQNQVGTHFDNLGMIEKAILWFRKADAQGLIISTHNLACKLYEQGNKKEGRLYFEKAAKLNYPASLYYMGVIFERENDCRSISCYRKAAQLGNEQALKALVDLRLEFMIDNIPVDHPINF